MYRVCTAVRLRSQSLLIFMLFYHFILPIGTNASHRNRVIVFKKKCLFLLPFLTQEACTGKKPKNKNTETKDRQVKKNLKGPLLLFLHSPSGNHQWLTQEGAAMPYWGARERLLFPLGVGETTIASALQCKVAQSSEVQPNVV